MIRMTLLLLVGLGGAGVFLAASTSGAVDPQGTVGFAESPAEVAPVDCSLCSGHARIECGRCAGKGQRAVKCSRCAGRRKIECPVRACSKGKWPCGNCGGEGRVQWTSGSQDPCKVCAKKGRQTCGFCKGKASLDCPACERAGRIEFLCGACFGFGFHPCPRCKPSGTCGGCEGRQEVDCISCQGDGHDELTCEDCLGYELLFCKEKRCAAGSEICSRCYGTGKIRMQQSGGAKAGVSKCTNCKTRGYSKCESCDGRGATECTAPTPTQTCRRCSGGRVDCPLCAG